MRTSLPLCFVAFALVAAAPPVPTAPSGLGRGALVIVGGGSMPASIRNRFLELAGGPKARIVVIPTASSYADQPREDESFLAPWKKAGVKDVRRLHTHQRVQADNPIFSKALEEATGVWISGGDQSRVVEAYRGTLVEAGLRRLLARGGVVGGTSAGAAVMSGLMITGGRREASLDKGFGLLPGKFVVDQHFLKRDRAERLLGVLERNPDHTGIGIDEATAVVVQANQIEVVGDSYVLVFLPGTRQRLRILKSGDRLELPSVK